MCMLMKIFTFIRKKCFCSNETKNATKTFSQAITLTDVTMKYD